MLTEVWSMCFMGTFALPILGDDEHGDVVWLQQTPGGPASKAGQAPPKT
jgi:hypothetical protein